MFNLVDVFAASSVVFVNFVFIFFVLELVRVCKFAFLEMHIMLQLHIILLAYRFLCWKN